MAMALLAMPVRCTALLYADWQVESQVCSSKSGRICTWRPQQEESGIFAAPKSFAKGPAPVPYWCKLPLRLAGLLVCARISSRDRSAAVGGV